MKLKVTIEIEASETIVGTIKRGSFSVDKDGSGHKLVIGNDVVVPSRKCSIKFLTNKDEIKDESEFTEISDLGCS